MSKHKHLLFFLIFGLFFFYGHAFAANYPLEITQPQEGLTTHSRYYKAYPGIEYRVPVGVFGGSYPFTYELINAPSGMSIDSFTGIITWGNPTTSGSPHTVRVRVTDAEGSTDTHTWPITVTTSGFIFLDASAAEGGDGTISRPLNQLSDVWGSDGYSRVYNDYFMYFRQGTYGLDGGRLIEDFKIEWRPGDSQPHVWMAYPGENVVIDHDLAPGTNGAFISNSNGDTDIFFSGIRFQDMRNHAVRGGGIRSVYFECNFYNGGPGQDGWNSSFIMYTGTRPQIHHYPFIKNCTFDAGRGHFSYIKTYGTYKSVFEGNSFRGPSDHCDGLALKAYDQYVSVRANTFDGNFIAGSISGNWNDGHNFDISFNKINGTENAIVINYHGTSNGPVYMYRNTFAGMVMLRKGVSGNGPFYLYNNVIVNENGEIYLYDVNDPSVLIVGSDASRNITGSASDGIIDGNGELTQAYAEYIGRYGHMLGGSSEGGSLPPDNNLPPVAMPSTPEALRIVQ